MVPTFLVNGIACEQITVQDRGLHYGDGLFETIAVNDFVPLCWSKHLLRLQSGCKRLGIECPDVNFLEQEARNLYTSIPRAVLKIIITRGQGGRGYRVPERDKPTRIIALYPWPEFPPEYLTTGVSIRICQTCLGRNKQLAGIKHLNKLEQVLARKEWSDPGIAEGIMQDDTGNLIEGTMSNLFILRQDELFTPDLSECGVEGITRANIMEIATSLGINVRVKPVTIDELYSADEIFICNSVVGVWPVRQVDKHQFNTGPFSQKICESLLAEGFIAPI
jgi:4-amino-4-deoxychorismate lyase